MGSTRAFSRLGLLAVGLGIGGAVASVPGTAFADTIDSVAAADSVLSGLAPAASIDALFPDLDIDSLFPNLNMAISFNGMDLFESGSADANSSGLGSFAFAYGADSQATATGAGNIAAVYGSNSFATAGGEGATGNTALVLGDQSSAFAGGADSSGNAAAVYGLGSHAIAGGFGDNPGNLNIAGVVGDHGSATAGSSSLGAGSFNIAYVEGNDVGAANATGASNMIDINKFYDNWGFRPVPAPRRPRTARRLPSFCPGVARVGCQTPTHFGRSSSPATRRPLSTRGPTSGMTCWVARTHRVPRPRVATGGPTYWATRAT